MSHQEEIKDFQRIETTHNSKSQSNKVRNSASKNNKWTEEEDKALREIIDTHGAKNWKKICSFMPGRTSTQCLHRWKKILQPGLIKGPWNVKEDQLLRKWVAENGPCRWSEATKIIEGRSGKQIRERWFNTLDPKLKKGNWTQVEEQYLIQLVMKFGPKWSKLVGFFSGRTENSIKNRLYCILRKVANEKRKAGEIDTKYLDPEQKELQCTAEELLDFQPDALKNYEPDVLPLPEKIDINNPIVLISDTQKRFKKSHTEDILLYPQQPGELPPMPMITTRGGPYPPFGGEDQMPRANFMNHSSAHLNELSSNLARNKYNRYQPDRIQNYPGMQGNPQRFQGVNEIPPLGRLNSQNKGEMQDAHFHRLTESNNYRGPEVLPTNEQKQSQTITTRKNNAEIRMEIGAPENLEHLLSQDGVIVDEAIKNKIEHLQQMKNSVKELEMMIKKELNNKVNKS